MKHVTEMSNCQLNAIGDIRLAWITLTSIFIDICAFDASNSIVQLLFGNIN